MAIVELVIVPLGTETASVSKYVAECHKVLAQANDLKYQLTPMSTIIEGELDRIFEVIRLMHEIPFQFGALRVGTTIRIDERRDKKLTMDGKVQAVMEKL